MLNLLDSEFSSDLFIPWDIISIRPMKRHESSQIIKILTIIAGGAALIFGISNLPPKCISVGYLSILVFSSIVAPRMSLTLPHARFAISFSDALVFLSFLLYGGPAAVIVAAVSTIGDCFNLSSRGFEWGRFMIAVNVGINTISIAVVSLIWSNLQQSLFTVHAVGSTQHLIATLGAIAILHFVISSFLATIFQALKENASFFATWKRDCFSSSITQIVGAGLAGLFYKLISFGDIVTGLIAFGAIGIAYLSYRQSIDDINSAIGLAEAAEREKAETERELRREAERHAEQLAISLENQEFANQALRKSEQNFQHAALHDSLTKLPNRKYLGDMLRGLISEYKDDPTKQFYVLFLDIHRFKNINDSLGHAIGDKVLTIASKRFVRMLEPRDTVARIGGDEFAIVLRGPSSVSKAQKVARRIHESISQPFSLGGNRISISVNIGIAPCDAEYNATEEVLRDADIAMHYAKEKQSGVATFTKELRSRFLERVRYEMDLSHAVERNELSMHYQPLINLSDGSLLGFEALLRWNHSEFGMIPPNKFIPIAEDSGLIIPITTWILKETTRQMAEWQTIGKGNESLIVSVNISGKHLSNDDLIADVEDALSASNLSPRSLKLEITESAAMENPEHTIKILKKLKRTGVKLSIDDFGTGYSSLSILHRLPFDTLKIDRSFVIAVGDNGEDSEILQTIISLAKNLKMRVIAEGIETESQLRLLQALGCDYGQGYLMSRPQNKDKTEQSLYECRNWLPVKNGDGGICDRILTEQMPVDSPQLI